MNDEGANIDFYRQKKNLSPISTIYLGGKIQPLCTNTVFLTHKRLILFLDPKMKKLSPEQVNNISTLLNDGKSIRDIANIIGCSKSTVINYRKINVNQLPKIKMGRPCKLSPRDKRAIKHFLTNGEAKTAVDIKKKLDQERGERASTQTIRNALKEQGLRAVKKVKR